MANLLTKNPLVILAGLIIGITVLTMVRANAKDKAKKDAADLANKLSPGNSGANGGTAAAPTIKPVVKNTTSKILLMHGSTGEMVKSVQRKLGVSPTGYFGDETRSAVIAFQRKNGLLDDGKVGEKTLAKLYADRPGDLVNMIGNYGGADGGLWNTIKPGQTSQNIGPIVKNPISYNPYNPYGLIMPR